MKTEDLKRTIGQRLQRIRLDKHFTQEHMGELLNISTSAYCKMEYGETDLTLTRINQIADIFGVTGSQLLGMLEGGPYINNNSNCSFGPVAHSMGTVNITEANEVKELLIANARLIETLCNKLDLLK